MVMASWEVHKDAIKKNQTTKHVCSSSVLRHSGPGPRVIWVSILGRRQVQLWRWDLRAVAQLCLHTAPRAEELCHGTGAVPVPCGSERGRELLPWVKRLPCASDCLMSTEGFCDQDLQAVGLECSVGAINQAREGG